MTVARKVTDLAARKGRSGRLPNKEVRSREYLTQEEVEKLVAVAKTNRWADRDSAAILICFRHGLRASLLPNRFRNFWKD